MFWTSRRETDIRISFEALECSSMNIDIDLSKYKPAINHDIGLYIDKILASAAYKSWPDGLKKEARTTLIKNSDGM
jgi:hypothetical protein